MAATVDWGRLPKVSTIFVRRWKNSDTGKAGGMGRLLIVYGVKENYKPLIDEEGSRSRCVL